VHARQGDAGGIACGGVDLARASGEQRFGEREAEAAIGAGDKCN